MFRAGNARRGKSRAQCSWGDVLNIQRILGALEAWLTSYRVEHLQLGLQMAVCLVIALIPVLVTDLFKFLDEGGSVLYTAITVAVVLEPSTGASLKKLLLRALGAGLAGGVGLLALFFAVGSKNEEEIYSYGQYSEPIASWVGGSMAVLGFILMTNKQRYYQHHEFWATALFALPIITVPAIRCGSPSSTGGCHLYTGAVYRMINVLIGIVIASVVSFVVFPVRARGLLQKKMASTLTQIGDLGVWLVGQVCVLPHPASNAHGTASLPGASGTDDNSLYTDDGLRVRFAPLLKTAADLTADLAYMGKLLKAARTEVYLLSHPRTFPTQQYRNLLDSCHVTLGIFLGLLHSLQSGEISLECCQRHIGDLSETGVRLSAAFTALSSLIRPPKGKKKAKRGGKGERGGTGKEQGAQVVVGLQQARSGASGVKAESGQAGAAATAAPAAAVGAAAGPAAAEGAAAGAAAEAAAAGLDPVPPQQRQRQQQQLLADLEVGEPAEDDPFAELADEPPGCSTPRVAASSDTQLPTAQQTARHLSRVVNRSQRAGSSTAAAGSSTAAAGSGTGATSVGPAGEVLAHGGQVKGAFIPSQGPRLNGGSLAAGSAGSEAVRGDWVQSKVMALVDSVKQLEEDAYKERLADANAAGLPAFMLVVHACLNTMRQCGACFTALDPKRGRQVHAYCQAARKTGRLTQPVGLPAP